MELKINDVRAKMPNYEYYKDWQRNSQILGIAVHHSATADRSTGAPIGDAFTFFDYHVKTRGWTHGGYNYVITGSGEIQYALDEKISAYHAGFKDPDNSEGMEYGQYWNNHFLALCLAGWFSENRIYRDSGGHNKHIPNNYTFPTEAQQKSLLALIQYLREKYNIPVENIRGHRELAGNNTTCPGYNFDPAELRARIGALDAAEPDASTPPTRDTQPDVRPGQHVLLLPDTDQYLDAALAYVWKFRPDVSFSVDEAVGRWDYVTALGTDAEIHDSQLARLRGGGAKLVQRVSGLPQSVQSTLDGLVEKNLRFLVSADEPPPESQPPPEAPWQTYTVQPGDTLSLIARQFYGQSGLWRFIFEANQEILSEPGHIRPGQTLKIPPKPAAS